MNLQTRRMGRLLLPVAFVAWSVASVSIAADSNHDIVVLSNRADLISGGDALVELVVPPGIIESLRHGGNVKIQASLNGSEGYLRASPGWTDLRRSARTKAR